MELKEVFEPIINFLKNFQKREKEELSKNKAKERLQLVLMQDRASVSPDFFEMMKKEIIEVIKKYIDIDEETLEVQLTRGMEGEGGTGPALYANIPIKNIKPIAKKVEPKEEKVEVIENEEKEETVDEKELANTIIEEIKNIAEEKQGQTPNNSKNKKNKKQNKNYTNQEEKNQNIQNVESVEEQKEEIVSSEPSKEETEKGTVDEITFEEASENVAEQVENVEIKKDFKEKLTDIKGGVKEKFNTVKTSAKEGFEKIKSKVKAKN